MVPRELCVKQSTQLESNGSRRAYDKQKTIWVYSEKEMVIIRNTCHSRHFPIETKHRQQFTSTWRARPKITVDRRRLQRQTTTTGKTTLCKTSIICGWWQAAARSKSSNHSAYVFIVSREWEWSSKVISAKLPPSHVHVRGCCNGTHHRGAIETQSSIRLTIGLPYTRQVWLEYNLGAFLLHLKCVATCLLRHVHLRWAFHDYNVSLVWLAVFLTLILLLKWFGIIVGRRDAFTCDGAIKSRIPFWRVTFECGLVYISPTLLQSTGTIECLIILFTTCRVFW